MTFVAASRRASLLLGRASQLRKSSSNCSSSDFIARTITQIQPQRPAFVSNFLSSLSHQPQQQKRLFASSNLSSLLQREIVEETQTNPIEMPEDLVDLKKTLSSKWTIVDGSATESDGATVKMFKKEPTSNGSKVVLKFHCQDTAQEDEGILDAMSEDEDEEISPPLHFVVHVSRAGKTMKLVCVSEDAQAIVEGVTIVPSEDSSATTDEDELYRGPILEDLPEDVRVEFDTYVKEECGVDEDVATFVAMYADYREQAEYVRWLQEVKKIVGK